MSGYGENSSSAYDYLTYGSGYGYSVEPDVCDFGSVNTFGKVFLTSLYILVFIFGFLGNGLVVCVLVKNWNRMNLTDICLFNLALSDILFVLTLPLYTNYSLVGDWTFGDVMCRFAAASHNTGFFSSIFFMVVMTLDRYVVIMHALTVAQYRSLRVGIALSVLVWILSLIVSLPALVFTKMTNVSHGLSGCDNDPDNEAWKLYNLLSVNILGLVIPLLVMVFCYSRIIPTLVKMRSAKKHRVLKLIISIVVAFFLFWTPYNISLILKFLKSKHLLQGDICGLETNVQLVLTVTESLAYTHCCLNPIIYAFVGQKFMKRALQMLANCVDGIPLLPKIHLLDSSRNRSSAMSRSSEVVSTIM